MSDDRAGTDRRGPAADRRTYNRRGDPGGAPPYYAAFERMAQALERIAAVAERRPGGPAGADAPLRVLSPRRSDD